MRTLIHKETGERIYEEEFGLKNADGVINTLINSGIYFLDGEEIIIDIKDAPAYLEAKRLELVAREERIEQKEKELNIN